MKLVSIGRGPQMSDRQNASEAITYTPRGLHMNGEHASHPPLPPPQTYHTVPYYRNKEEVV